MVNHLDKSAAGGVSGWTNRTIREAPTHAFWRPCVELFFGADEASRLQDDDPFHLALHTALISVRGHALNKERDPTVINVRPLGIPEAIAQIACNCFLVQSDNSWSTRLFEESGQLALGSDGALLAFASMERSLEALVALGRVAGCNINDAKGGYNNLSRRSMQRGTMRYSPAAIRLYNTLYGIPYDVNIYDTAEPQDCFDIRDRAEPVHQFPIARGCIQGSSLSVLLYAVGLAELVRELREECETVGARVDSSLVGKPVHVTVSGDDGGESTVEASLVCAPPYAQARAAAKGLVDACNLTCMVIPASSPTRVEVPWEAVRYRFSPFIRCYIDDASATQDLHECRLLRDLMRDRGVSHGYDIREPAKNYTLIPPHAVREAQQLFPAAGECIIYTDKEALEGVSFKCWLKQQQSAGALKADTLVLNGHGCERLLGWPLRVSRALSGVNPASPTAIHVEYEHEVTLAFQQHAVSNRVLQILEAFRALGLRAVDEYVCLASQRLRAHMRETFAVANQRRLACEAGRRLSKAEEAAAVAASQAQAQQREGSEARQPRLPATFESKQIIALVTKLCLASRAAHFARALPAAVCQPGVAAVEGALLETYASLMERQSTAIAPVMRDVIISAQADGGCATVSGVPCRSYVTQEGEGDGEHASLVAAAAKVDRHLVESSAGQEDQVAAGLSPRLSPVHLVAAHRVHSRGQLSSQAALTNCEEALRVAVAACQRCWGARRLAAPPNYSAGDGAALQSSTSCPFTFTTLHAVSLRRSSLMRYIRNAAANRRFASATPRQWAALTAMRDQSNSFMNALPATDAQSIASRCVAGMLRSRYFCGDHVDILATGAPHLHDGPGGKPVLLGPGEVRTLESSPKLGNVINRHDEICHALGSAIIPTALGAGTAVHYEKLLVGTDSDDPGGTAEDDPGDRVFDDVSFAYQGVEYRIDVAVVNVNTATVEAACRSSNQGLNNVLDQKASAKLRRATPWLSEDGMSTSGNDATNPTSRSQSILTSAASASNIGISASGARVFVPFIMASSGSLSASAAAFLKALCAIKRRAGTDIMALQAGAVATEATWAARTFSSWARQRLSLCCVAMLGRGVQNILDNDKLASLPGRGRGQAGRPAQAVRYSVAAAESRKTSMLRVLRDVAARA